MSLGYESESYLKNFLVAIGDGEQGLEAARSCLCRIADFAPHSAFQRIDRNGNGYVCEHEIQKFLNEQRVYSISNNELYRLISFFDANSSGRLCFQE